MNPGPGEQLRRDDAPPGLFLSRQGTWYDDGGAVTHHRLAALLHRCVDRDAAGRLVVTTGRDVLPFAAEDAPLFVRTLLADDAGLGLLLSDETVERLHAGSEVSIDAEGRVRARVRGGRFWALFLRPAAQLLVPYLDDDGARIELPGTTLPLRPVALPLDWSA